MRWASVVAEADNSSSICTYSYLAIANAPPVTQPMYPARRVHAVLACMLSRHL
jgi:hypothetical protein